MKLKDLMPVIPRKEFFELVTRDNIIGVFTKDDSSLYEEYLEEPVFMVSSDSSVLEIVLL